MFDPTPFKSAAGLSLGWKIECDILTDKDWELVASLIAAKINFRAVEGVPSGGLILAHALKQYINYGPLLIVDDVLTTGSSMERQRAGRSANGVVLFARAECPHWVRPIFTLEPWV